MDNKKRRILILVLVFLGVFLYAGLQYLSYPQWLKVKQTVQEITGRQNHLSSLEESSRLSSTFAAKISELKTETAALRKKIPGEPDKLALMKALYAIAENNGVKPESLNFEAVQQQNGFHFMPVLLTCSATPENINKLLNGFVKRQDYILVLDSLNTERKGMETTARIRLLVYYYPDK